MICDNLSISDKGHLLFAGQDTVELAAKYGTPVYLLDEDKIREKCRAYKNAFLKYFDERAIPLYASKANSFKRLYEIMTEEGMGIERGLTFQRHISIRTIRLTRTFPLQWITE